ncbi:beta-galactosidase [Sphingomonas canadensis]|uniref:Beta-galactosidase n=1 Tax=Sphingomonas canadensis TaxID=1219257 RepID=A0ABW3H724_9SPHN|nr:beta-galactosidase [Sphingomonas canadensis]MCW3837054.1 beta-galactosidase [Sphingomonas canadensis]
MRRLDPRKLVAPHGAKLKAMRLNTVLAPISWELIEPAEGRFDFATVDWLNGDRTDQGRHVRLPPDGFGIQKIRLCRD